MSNAHLMSRHRPAGHAAFTLIELAEALVALILARWLARVVGCHFEGAWYTVVYWTIQILGAVVIFVCLVSIVGRLPPPPPTASPNEPGDKNKTA